jgi:flagellar biosynthesis protein FliP
MLGPGREQRGQHLAVAFVGDDAHVAQAAVGVVLGLQQFQGFFALFAALVEVAGLQAEVGKEDFTIVIPAFLVTELGEAFALGFAIFLPFLIIDLVVANVLLALGMQSLNPTQISLPFKLLLFVAADGWGLLAASLVSGSSAG